MSTSVADSLTCVPQTSKRWFAWELTCNFVLAAFFLQFVVINGSDLLSAFRFSTLLLLIKVSTDAALHLVRAPAKQISHSVFDWGIGIAGSFTTFFYRSAEGQDFWLGTAIQLLGLSLAVAAMCSLNRSIGFVAANRGIKTSGLYRLVRHPMYFAYIVAFGGFVINQWTLNNAVVFAVMVYCFFLRTLCEERVLSEDSDYREYKRRVKYRLIPKLL